MYQVIAENLHVQGAVSCCCTYMCFSSDRVREGNLHDEDDRTKNPAHLQHQKRLSELSWTGWKILLIRDVTWSRAYLCDGPAQGQNTTADNSSNDVGSRGLPCACTIAISLSFSY